MSIVWTEDEREYIRKYIHMHACSQNDEKMAAVLSEWSGRPVTLVAVRRQRQKLGLKKKPGRGVCDLDN